MLLVPCLLLSFLVTGHAWLLIAHLVAWWRTRAVRPYGLRSAGLVLLGGLILVLVPRLPHPVFLVLAAEGMLGLLGGLYSNTLRCAETRAYRTPRDLLCFRPPVIPAPARGHQPSAATDPRRSAPAAVPSTPALS